MVECKLNIKNEINENKETIIYGFKHVKTDQVEKYTMIGCESDELYEHDKLFKFWSNKGVKKEIEKRDFKMTGCFVRP